MTFINIFSKTKKKKQQQRTVIADHRERNALVASHLINKGIEVSFEQLDIADYLVNGIAIERKRISDLKASIINKRLMRQLQGLRQYEQRLLLIEGLKEEDLYGEMIHDNALRGFLLSVVLNSGVPIIFTEDAEDSARYIEVLARKKSKSEVSTRPPRILLTDNQRAQYILEGFPGIGPVTAKKLLEKFKTLKNIFAASETELEEILGKKSVDVARLLSRSYDA